jgi:glycosyltransferase involved in cell wall biosynthesis
MRIGIVYYGVYPWNRGIDQLAQSLRYLGYEPIIVARFPESNERVKEVNNIPVIQVPPISRGRIQRLKVFPIPFNLFWRNWLVDLGRKFHWQGIIVRETPLSWPVLSAARKLAIPAYLDMRENLGAMYQAGQARNWILRIMRKPFLVRLYEKLTVKHFDHIFTVSEELKDWLTATYAVRREKVSVLENTPHEQFLRAAKKALEDKCAFDGFIRIVYAGVIKEAKGIGDIISSMPYVLLQCPQVRLRIIGDGPALKQMKTLVRDLNLKNEVNFLPMLTMPSLAKALADCDIGIESCWLNELTHQTLPGKLFEYMALCLPILSSARRPVIRILEEVGCGQIYYSRYPKEIGQAIISMVTSDTARREMAQRARRAALERYNWCFTLESLRKGLSFP